MEGEVECTWVDVGVDTAKSEINLRSREGGQKVRPRKYQRRGFRC